MKDNTKSSSSRLSNIWLTVLLLIVLILATAALLGSLIKRYVSNEKNVIAVIAGSNQLRQEFDDDSLPVGAEPALKPSWENSTSVDLFKTTYTDSNGNITVQSADNNKVIAPGTANDYEFNLKNTGNISLDYTLTLEGVFDLDDHHLPFYVRLLRGNEYVVGGEDKWVNVDMLKTVVEKDTLPIGGKVTYTFQWQWPFESDKESEKLINNLNDTILGNSHDTKLGNIPSDVNADFHLDIITSAEVTPGAVAAYNDGTKVLNEFIFDCLMAGLMLGSGIWLILLFFRRKIYFTGLLAPALGGEIKLGKAKSELEAFGRFIFPKARFGKRTLQTDTAEMVIRIKSRKVPEGVRFEHDDDKTIIIVGRKIRAIELHISNMGGRLTIDTVNWAAIDKKHNVYTIAGIIEPVDKKNTTPYGLSIDEDNKLFIQR